MFPNYSILFKDINPLYEIFEETKKKEGFVGGFKPFLAWTFEELYHQKIIDKKIFNELNKILDKLNFEIRRNFTGISGYA